MGDRLHLAYKYDVEYCSSNPFNNEAYNFFQLLQEMGYDICNTEGSDNIEMLEVDFCDAIKKIQSILEGEPMFEHVYEYDTHEPEEINDKIKDYVKKNMNHNLYEIMEEMMSIYNEYCKKKQDNDEYMHFFIF